MVLTDLRLTVQFTVGSRYFKIQLVIEDKASSAQT